MSLVTIKLQGGLGNILFQIFTTISYGKKFGKEPIFSYKNYYPVHSNIKDYEFIFNDVTFINDKINYINTYNELENFKYSEIPNYNVDLCLNGYFQSQLYFENINPIDYFNDKFIEETKQTYQFLLNKPTISLHVRRGDYLKLQEYHPIQTNEYYFSAINKIKEIENKDYNILVFTDDMNYVRENFKNDNFIFINAKDYHSLFLMSFCEHNIMSNSSFSWWGSFLNQNLNKIVIAPKNWFGKNYSHFDTSNIYIKNSILL